MPILTDEQLDQANREVTAIKDRVSEQLREQQLREVRSHHLQYLQSLLKDILQQMHGISPKR